MSEATAIVNPSESEFFVDNREAYDFIKIRMYTKIDDKLAPVYSDYIYINSRLHLNRSEFCAIAWFIAEIYFDSVNILTKFGSTITMDCDVDDIDFFEVPISTQWIKKDNSDNVLTNNRETLTNDPRLSIVRRHPGVFTLQIENMHPKF